MTNDHMSSFTRISTNSFLLDSDLQSTDDRYNQDQYKSEVLLFHVHDRLRIYYEWVDCHRTDVGEYDKIKPSIFMSGTLEVIHSHYISRDNNNNNTHIYT